MTVRGQTTPRIIQFRTKNGFCRTVSNSCVLRALFLQRAATRLITQRSHVFYHQPLECALTAVNVLTPPSPVNPWWKPRNRGLQRSERQCCPHKANLASALQINPAGARGVELRTSAPMCPPWARCHTTLLQFGETFWRHQHIEQECWWLKLLSA